MLTHEPEPEPDQTPARPPALNLTFDAMSIVDTHTGAAMSPDEFTTELRALERTITDHDDAIRVLQADLKAARELREKAIAQLRVRIRDGKALPLFADPPDPPAEA